jgi:hypothetical protein
MLPLRRSWLAYYRKNVYSQNGEDGIIAEILRRLQISNGYVCEFGAADGKKYSNTFALIERGFKGVYIEADERWYPFLLDTCQQYPNILPIKSKVMTEGESSLDNILSKTPMPINFDVLSIDIDSYDYQVWDSVKKYRPKIVIIEINGGIDPTARNIIPNPWQSGTGFWPMRALGESKGYNLICHTGNLIFVRSDLGISGDRTQFKVRRNLMLTIGE